MTIWYINRAFLFLLYIYQFQVPPKSFQIDSQTFIYPDWKLVQPCTYPSYNVWLLYINHDQFYTRPMWNSTLFFLKFDVISQFGDVIK